MNRWSILFLSLSHCYCKLVINSNQSVTGIVEKSISLKWEMKNDGFIYSAMVYINNWNKLIIDTTGAATVEGEKLFGNRISRRFWKAKLVNYYELTIKNLSYSDAHIFQIEVVYKDGNGLHIKQDNTSSINLEVKGGVDKLKPLEDTVEFGDNISQTFHLSGNPEPKVSCEINDGETDVVSGTLVDEKTRKYKYNVNLKMKPFHCGKTIKYQFIGFNNHTHEIKLIPKRVEGIRYELNATNCTTVEWEQVNYGTCYPDLKYRLTFVTNNGSIYQRETNMINQTTFVECRGKSLQDAHFVNMRAVHKKFTGKPSRNVTRTDIMDSGTTKETFPDSENSGKSNGMLWIIMLVSTVLVLLIIVFCFCMFKTNQHFRNFFLKTSSREKAEVKRLNSKNLDKEKQILQIENGTTEKKSPSLDEDSPFIEDSSFIDTQHPTYAQYEPNVSPKQPTTPPPVYSFVEPYRGNSSNKDGLYAPVNESGKDPEIQQTYTKPCLDYVTIPGESDKEVPQRKLKTDNGGNLKSYDPNGQKDDIQHPSSNPGYYSEYDTVIDPPNKEIPTYAVVDKSSKQLKRQEEYPTDSFSSQPLLLNEPQTKDDYEEVTSVVPGKSYRRKESKGTSRSDYDEIDQYALL